MTIILAACLVLAQTLTAEQVNTAIAEGAKQKDQLHTIGVRLMGQHGGFNVSVLGPMNRIALMSATEARQYRALDPQQVTLHLLSGIDVTASPKAPEWFANGWSITPPATGLVVRTKAGAILRPDSVELVPDTYRNTVGGAVDVRGVIARFTSLPEGELEIIVTTNASERKYTLKAKDRSKIR